MTSQLQHAAVVMMPRMLLCNKSWAPAGTVSPQGQLLLHQAHLVASSWQTLIGCHCCCWLQTGRSHQAVKPAQGKHSMNDVVMLDGFASKEQQKAMGVTKGMYGSPAR